MWKYVNSKCICAISLFISHVLDINWWSNLIVNDHKQCSRPNGLRRYLVCNPATDKWHVLPRSIRSIGQDRLGFDPTSSHFHVIEFVEVEGVCSCGDLLI